MTHKIRFHRDTTVLADNNREYNRMLIEQKKTYINDLLLKERGYVYLNDIYEIFGLNKLWNPLDENPCCINSDNTKITFVIDELTENDFNIIIIW